MKSLKKFGAVSSGATLIILLIILWEAAPRLGWANPTFIPPFSTVLNTVFGAGGDTPPSIAISHIANSLRRVLIGFAICVILGVPIAFLLGGAFPKVTPWLRSLFQFLSQIPPYILYPVIILFMSQGETGIIFIITWTGFWPVLFTTLAGIADIDPKLIKCARGMNANRFVIFFKVVIPAVFPNIMRGIRLGLNVGFLILIGAETMGANSGVGWLIQNAQRMGNVNRIYLGALMAAIIGSLLNWVMEKIESRVVSWKPLPEEAII